MWRVKKIFSILLLFVLVLSVFRFCFLPFVHAYEPPRNEFEEEIENRTDLSEEEKVELRKSFGSLPKYVQDRFVQLIKRYSELVGWQNQIDDLVTKYCRCVQAEQSWIQQIQTAYPL